MKALIYVCKAKPFLYEVDAANGPHYFTEDIDYGNDNPKLNGLVPFECECNEAEFFKYVQGDLDEDDFTYRCWKENKRWDEQCAKKSGGMDEWALRDYSHYKDIYAYHFENIRPIDEPFPITELYSDDLCMKPLKAAPQSYCYAYRKIKITYEKFRELLKQLWFKDHTMWKTIDDECFYSEKYLVFSIQSPYVALEANTDPETGKPFKDLEIRKTMIKNAGIEYHGL